MHAHISTLPHSCLLTLHTEEKNCSSLAKALHQALRSNRHSIWVDCRNVVALPAEALLLLRQCAKRLWQHGGYLVVCHLPAAAQAILAADTNEPLAASLLDAAQYGLDYPEASVH